MICDWGTGHSKGSYHSHRYHTSVRCTSLERRKSCWVRCHSALVRQQHKRFHSRWSATSRKRLWQDSTHTSSSGVHFGLVAKVALIWHDFVKACVAAQQTQSWASCEGHVSLAGMGSVLVINSGSSSLKFKLFTSAAQKLSAVVTGLVDRIGDVEHSQLVVTNQKSNPQAGKQTYKVRLGFRSLGPSSISNCTIAY